MHYFRYFSNLVLSLTVICCQPKPAEQPEADQVYISAQGQSDERAYKLLPRKGSEDVGHLLVFPRLPHRPKSVDSVTLYFANKRFDWIIQFKPTSPTIEQHQVEKYLNRQWRQNNGTPQLYGLSTRDNRWTYIGAAGADSVFSELALGWKLVDERTQNPRPFSVAELEGFRARTARLASFIPGRVTDMNFSPRQAAAASQQLASFVAANYQPVIIVLKADSPFQGAAIWDAMMSLGLRWGDMDLFHWENPDVAAGGDDHIFSISTSTEPGYFFPERIAAGEVQTTDLIFSFLVPRTAEPEQVLTNMHKAAGYCQQKLGGKLLAADGSAFDLNSEKQRCRLIAQRLGELKLRPGYEDALYLFQ